MLRRTIHILTCTAVAPLLGCDPPPLTPNGVIAVYGGVGLGDGQFSYPRAIAAEPNGSVFVVDKNGRVQRFSPNGDFETFWRMPETTSGKPVGLAVHPDGRIFVADTHYHRVLIYDRDGTHLGAFGRKGLGDGEMQLPTDVAVDADGFIYVSEYHENDRITKWSPSLEYVQAIGMTPVDGMRLRRPAAIDIDAEQTIWVADACNHRIVRFATDGTFLGAFGEMGTEPGKLKYPYDITVSPDDKSLMVCEYGSDRLQWFDKSGKSLRTWGGGGREVGKLWAPWGATYGPGDNVYVVDSLNSRIQVIRP